MEYVILIVLIFIALQLWEAVRFLQKILKTISAKSQNKSKLEDYV